MEKFRSTADPSTGIHPFIPVRPSSSIISVVAKLLIIVRLPLLFVLSFIYSILSIIPLVLAALPSLAFPLHRLIDYTFLSPILLCTSVWCPTVPTVDRPRVRTDPSLQARAPSRGDVIFTNHASILDLLYLTRAYSSLFVVPSPDTDLSATSSTPDDSVIPISLLSALTRVSCAPSPNALSGRKGTTITALSSQRSAPIVVLAEGCSSNSRGVLKFCVSAPLNRSLDSSVRLFALGFSYSRDCREVNTLSSPIVHVLRLMTLPCANIRARVAAIPPDAIDIHKTVASLAGVPPLTIGREHGARFFTHWNESKNLKT